MAQNAPIGSFGDKLLRPFLGPCSSSAERLKRLCMFRRADCGFGRIAAMTGLERIAECDLGALRCNDPSHWWEYLCCGPPV
eukprot:5586589-Alexandrium_andersonii.AAC.1